MKRRFKIRKEIRYTFLQVWVSINIFKKYLKREMRFVILIYRSKAGYKIYGVEILREKKSRMNPFKKTALSIPFYGGWIHRFHVSEDNDERSVTSTSKHMHIPLYKIFGVGKSMSFAVFFGRNTMSSFRSVVARLLPVIFTAKISIDLSLSRTNQLFYVCSEFYDLRI